MRTSDKSHNRSRHEGSMHAKPFKAGGAAPKGKYIGQEKKVAGNTKGNRENC